MFIIIPLALGIILEFALEPSFKIRENLFIRLDPVAAGALAIMSLLPYGCFLLSLYQ